MALRNEICEIPAVAAWGWAMEKAGKMPQQGDWVSVGESVYIDGELTELHIYYSSDGSYYLTTDPRV
jgi:hypothetical protein